MSLLASLAMSTVPARAQRAPLPGGGSDGVRSSDADAIRTTHRTAACTVRSRPAPWADVLAQVPGSQEERSRITAASSNLSACLGLVAATDGSVQLSFQPSVIRGPMAEALYERNRVAGSRRVPLAPPFDWSAVGSPQAMAAPTRAALVMLGMAECVHRAVPQDVDALLATRPASDDELAAIRRISPHLDPCLSAGVNFRLNRPALRGALAEAAYRSAAAAASISPQPVQD